MDLEIPGFPIPDSLLSVTQNRIFGSSTGSNSPRSRIYSLLYGMAGMTTCPRPFDAMRFCGIVQTFPPTVIRLATKTSHHGFNHVTRVGEYLDATWLTQLLKPNSGCDNLCLLIGCVADVFTHRLPGTAITMYCDCRCTRNFTAIAKTGA